VFIEKKKTKNCSLYTLCIIKSSLLFSSENVLKLQLHACNKNNEMLAYVNDSKSIRIIPGIHLNFIGILNAVLEKNMDQYYKKFESTYLNIKITSIKIVGFQTSCYFHKKGFDYLNLFNWGKVKKFSKKNALINKLSSVFLPNIPGYFQIKTALMCLFFDKRLSSHLNMNFLLKSLKIKIFSNSMIYNSILKLFNNFNEFLLTLGTLRSSLLFSLLSESTVNNRTLFHDIYSVKQYQLLSDVVHNKIIFINESVKSYDYGNHLVTKFINHEVFVLNKKNTYYTNFYSYPILVINNTLCSRKTFFQIDHFNKQSISYDLEFFIHSNLIFVDIADNNRVKEGRDSLSGIEKKFLVYFSMKTIYFRNIIIPTTCLYYLITSLKNKLKYSQILDNSLEYYLNNNLKKFTFTLLKLLKSLSRISLKRIIIKEFVDYTLYLSNFCSDIQHKIPNLLQNNRSNTHLNSKLIHELIIKILKKFKMISINALIKSIDFLGFKKKNAVKELTSLVVQNRLIVLGDLLVSKG